MSAMPLRSRRPRARLHGHLGLAMPGGACGAGRSCPGRRRERPGRGGAPGPPRKELRSAFILRLFAVERFLRGILVAVIAYAAWRFKYSRHTIEQAFDRELPVLRSLLNGLGYNVDHSEAGRADQARVHARSEDADLAGHGSSGIRADRDARRRSVCGCSSAGESTSPWWRPGSASRTRSTSLTAKITVLRVIFSSTSPSSSTWCSPSDSSARGAGRRPTTPGCAASRCCRRPRRRGRGRSRPQRERRRRRGPGAPLPVPDARQRGHGGRRAPEPAADPATR